MFLFRFRFLVFFDDGFAQYLTVKKLHLVTHAGNSIAASCIQLDFFANSFTLRVRIWIDEGIAAVSASPLFSLRIFEGILGIQHNNGPY